MGVSRAKEIHGTIICHEFDGFLHLPRFFYSPHLPQGPTDGGTWNFHLRIVLYQVHPMRQQCGKPERQEAKTPSNTSKKWSYLHFLGGSMGVFVGSVQHAYVTYVQ